MRLNTKHLFYFCFISVIMFLSSCQKMNTNEATDQQEPNTVQVGDFELMVAQGCPFAAKAEMADLSFTQVTDKNTKKTLVFGEKEIDQSVKEVTVFNVDGSACAQYVSCEEDIVDFEIIPNNYEDFLDLIDDPSILIGQLPHEKYCNCVKRVFHEFIDANEGLMETAGIVEYYIRDIFGDYLGAFVAIVGCSKRA